MPLDQASQCWDQPFRPPAGTLSCNEKGLTSSPATIKAGDYLDISTILNTLIENRIRATYAAVAEVLDMSPDALERKLRALGSPGSWVVDEVTGQPRAEFELADGLFTNSIVIRDAARLRALVYVTAEAGGTN